MRSKFWQEPHMVSARRSLIRAVYFSIGAFLILFTTFHIGGQLYIYSIGNKSVNAFQTGISKDLEYLKIQGDEVSKNEDLKKYLLTGDSEKLLALIQKERTNRSVGLMGVANKDGIIISRTKTPTRNGDNAFLVNPVGRMVAQGKSAQSVEAPTGFDPRQIFLNTGRPIFSNGEMIGGLFANDLADDSYAEKFRDSYLPQGSEILFYNKNGGVYGDSFQGEDTKKIIDSYFNTGSDWIKNADSDKTISFGKQNFYLVKNVAFTGLEKSPGGAIILVPRDDISWTTNLIIALLTLLIFVYLALKYHINTKGEARGWRYFVLLVFFSVPVFIISYLSFRIENLGYLKLQKIPYKLYNSTLRLQPESGVYDLDFEQRFSIYADTGDESINAVQIGLIFDPNMINVTSLDTASSACSLIVENKIDQNSGTADLTCGTLTPGGEQGSVFIADVVATPKQVGNFTLGFDSEKTKVLASDGLGTNVLRMSQSGSYIVQSFDAPTSTTKTITVFSSSHPNQSRWYNSNIVNFIWKGLPNETYSYSFDSSPNTIPGSTHLTKNTSVALHIPGDGVYYFHLKLTSGGPVTHYKVLSDQTPPTINAIHISQDTIKVGDVVRFSFDAEDINSGVQKNYYVDLGNHLFLPIGPDLFVPFMEAGDQKIILRVYDSAGNYTEKTQVIHVLAK